MISLAQPSMYSSAGQAPMRKGITPEPIPMLERKPSPLSMATDIAETKAIDYALNQVGKEGTKKALAAAGGTLMGPMGVIGGEVVGEMLAPFLKSLFFARGGYAGPLAMQPGGKVPSKFKGFAKLPEAVQQKISPDLAKKYDVGGRVGPDKSGEELMFGNIGMSPTSVNSTFQNFLQSGKMPLGAGYSVKPDAGKGSGSLTLEYQMSKDPTMNMMTGIKNMFNNFRGR